MKIERVRAMEILDSRGNPTVQAEVLLDSGVRATAQVPSGASTGRHEALELRDEDYSRYAGHGVLNAVQNIERVLGPAVLDMEAEDQAAIDGRLIEQGPGLGANATLAISCAVARAAAMASGMPLWKYLAGNRTPVMPNPMVNIISGGLHAGRNIEFQDFLVIPRGYPDLSSALEAVFSVHRMTGELLRKRGCVLTGVADEGGWGPRLGSNEEAVAILRNAIDEMPVRMDIALDVAATQFLHKAGYCLEGRILTSTEMTDLLEGWISRYGVTSHRRSARRGRLGWLEGDHEPPRFAGSAGWRRPVHQPNPGAVEPRYSRRGRQRGAGKDESDRHSEPDIRRD